MQFWAVTQHDNSLKNTSIERVFTQDSIHVVDLSNICDILQNLTNAFV